MIMKRILIFAIATVILSGSLSCKKFLDIKPIDKLTGNNFYQSKEDVEAAINDFSRKFYNKINETHFIGTVGEFRAGEVMHETKSVQNPAARAFVEVLGKNNLLDIVKGGMPWSDMYHFERITNWREYYEIIQGANILIDKLNDGVPGLSDAETKQYRGEAIFARCYAYYILVHLFGDVPYYTDAYHSEPLPREAMVSVFNKCIEDLKSCKDDMPWSYSDPAFKGVRASRGSVIALIMEMNMWNAGFDKNNATKYYEETASLGKELVQSKAYRLLPIAEWATVIKGRSDESLFEIFRTVNYGESNSGVAPIADLFIHYPYKRPAFQWEYSMAYYRASYMQKIFPSSEPDKRRDLWFENIEANTGEFMMLKYAQNSFLNSEDSTNPDNTFLVFRYAGEILLCAEALAELNRAEEATEMLNMVRNRAQASPYTGGGGQTLKDFIFLERSRELIGEGSHYFDLVRTRRILSSNWTYFPLTLDQFNRGGWTWPLYHDALINNPYMTLNMFWENGGI